MKKLWVLLLLCISILGINTTPAFADSLWEDKEVLILNSYSPDNVWTDSVVDGIYDSLDHSPYNINYQVEFMYSKRNYSDEYFESFLDHFTTKYANKKFDLVITTDDNAYEFLSKNRNEIAGDAPVVFTGINNLNEIHVPENTTGIHEKVDIIENLELIEKIHGKGSKVVLFSDFSQTSARVVKAIDEAVENTDISLEIETVITDNPSVITSRASDLTDEIALFVLFNRDMKGKYYTYNEGLRLVTQVTNIPIYSFWSFYMDYGIIGGKITEGHQLGFEAGKYGDQILNGFSIDELPILESQNKYIFDSSELSKQNISEDLLPEAFELINEEDKSVNSYFKLIPVLGIILITFLGVIMSYITLSQKNFKLQDDLGKMKEVYDKQLDEEKQKFEVKIKELMDQEEKLIQINEFLEEALQEKND